MQVLARVQVLRDRLSVVWGEAIEWPWEFCDAENTDSEINIVNLVVIPHTRGEELGGRVRAGSEYLSRIYFMGV